MRLKYPGVDCIGLNVHFRCSVFFKDKDISSFQKFFQRFMFDFLLEGKDSGIKLGIFLRFFIIVKILSIPQCFGSRVPLVTLRC